MENSDLQRLIDGYCLGISNLLRRIDGQDLARPYAGNANNYELGAALHKLSELRMWTDEFLRVKTPQVAYINHGTQPGSFPHFVEVAAMLPDEPEEPPIGPKAEDATPPAEGWTPELIAYWRGNEISRAGWDALPAWMKDAPAGFGWLEYPVTTPSGLEFYSTLTTKRGAVA